MQRAEQVIFSERLVLPDRVVPGAVVVTGELISSVLPGEKHRHTADLDVGGLALLPGLVDTHVHVNEPGRTHWEGFATAGRAAAAGGITTVVVMPLNCDPVVTTVAALEHEAAAAERSCVVDYGFWGGVVPGNAAEIEPLRRAGVLGFKCFMAPSGIDGFAHVTEADLRSAVPALLRCGEPPPLLVHAEDPALIPTERLPGDVRSVSRYIATRPPSSEVAAIRTIIRLAHGTGVRAHIVHLAAAEPIPDLAAARAAGARITVETCPHYLVFAAEEIADGATEFKCAPPIRESRHREALWDALRSGVIDLVATDHSPCPPDLKCLETGDFVRAWGGISSLQLSLQAVWTEAFRRGFALHELVRWMSDAPARLAGIDDRKGRIAPGMHADLVAFDPEAIGTVDAARLEHRHKLTPYDGQTLRGRVEWTMLRGRMIYRRAAGFEQEIPGRWLTPIRPPAPPTPGYPHSQS